MTNWSSISALEWEREWEKLAGFSPKAIDILIQGQPSNSDIEGNGGIDNQSVYSCGGDGGFSSCELGHASSSKSSFSPSAFGEFRNGFIVEKDLTCRGDISGNVACLGASQSYGQPKPTIGLKLSKRTYFEGFCAASSANAPSISVAPTGRSSRASYQSAHTPHCQVQGSNLDLKLAKDYHRRHRICEIHSKSPKVIVAGMERRFCQQCSRFHELSEFDGKKRSCRSRLSDHNSRRRRRRPQPETIQIDCSSRLYSSLLYDRRQQRNLVVNWVPSSTANPTWQSSWSFKAKQGGEEGFDRLHDFPTSTGEIVNAPFFYYGLGIAAFDPGSDVAPDFGCALFLLSTDNDNTLRLNNSEANSSLEMQLMQVNQTSSGSSSSSSGAVQAEAAMVHYSWNNFLNDMINNFSIIPLHEFQLLNEPACSFCSNRITTTTAEAGASWKSTSVGSTSLSFANTQSNYINHLFLLVIN